MLNLLTKTKPWMVASLLVATSVFGQDANKANGSKPKACAPAECKPKSCAPACPQPCPPTQMCPTPAPTCCPPWPVPVLNAAYNYPARTQTRCPWDVYADASFTYWQPLQEGMALAINGTLPTGGSTTTQLVGDVVDLDYDFAPGFKVGLGGFFDYDNWDLHAEYTWFRNKNHRNFSVSDAASSLQTLYPIQGHPGFTGSNVYDTVNGKWRLNMDLVDLDLGRWYYVGTKLTFRTGYGARGAFIRQKAESLYTNNGGNSIGTSGNKLVSQKSHSWAVGPMVSLDTNWNLGEGFRVIGNAELDVLYTRYTKLNSFQGTKTLAATAYTTQLDVQQKNAGFVRPHIDLEMGLGYGTYWDCNNWYTDIALTYGFQVFFNQNMLPNYNSATMLGNNIQCLGNLYVQGLTATFALTF